MVDVNTINPAVPYYVESPLSFIKKGNESDLVKKLHSVFKDVEAKRCENNFFPNKLDGSKLRGVVGNHIVAVNEYKQAILATKNFTEFDDTERRVALVAAERLTDEVLDYLKAVRKENELPSIKMPTFRLTTLALFSALTTGLGWVDFKYHRSADIPARDPHTLQKEIFHQPTWSGAAFCLLGALVGTVAIKALIEMNYTVEKREARLHRKFDLLSGAYVV